MTKGKIVSNSSPIIALSIIDKLSLLNDLYSEIFVPGAVYNEVVRKARVNKIGCLELEKAINNGKIHIYNIENTSLVSKLAGRLHEGELEVIVAAKELDLDTVLIDDKDALGFSKN
jgi:predicted nucleic acid-binding protein